MPTWPGTFPFLDDPSAHRESGPADNVTRTPVTSGPNKSRRRFTKAPHPISGNSGIMTDAQIDLFKAFFRDDLKDGALRFDATHPRTGATKSFRFTETYEIIYLHDDVARVSMQLEYLD